MKALLRPKSKSFTPHNTVIQKKKKKSILKQTDNRSALQEQQASVQRMIYQGEHLQELKSKQDPILQRKNKTGLPDNLKSGIENLSGISMDDVKVHYNSQRPAQLQAHAFAQGTQIHLGPGQEKHLAHEAWHVVQQKQGRVKPTIQHKGVNINDNQSLEREADVMGHHALQNSTPVQKVEKKTSTLKKVSLKTSQPVVQGMFFWNGAMFVPLNPIGYFPNGQPFYGNVPLGYHVIFVPQLGDYAVVPIPVPVAPMPMHHPAPNPGQGQVAQGPQVAPRAMPQPQVAPKPMPMRSTGKLPTKAPIKAPPPKVSVKPPTASKVVASVGKGTSAKPIVGGKESSSSKAIVPAKSSAKVIKDNKGLAPLFNDYRNHQKLLLNIFFQYFTERELMELRLVSRYHKFLADKIIKAIYVKYFGYSSELGDIKKSIMQELLRSSSAMLSVDQVTQARFLNELIGRTPTRINLGRDNRDLTGRGSAYDARVIHVGRGAKMHNKFWVLDHKRTITGSPNATPSAYGGNIETMVKIHSRQVASYFKRYFLMMRRGYSDKEANQMSNMIRFFNNDNRGMRLALAPFINIGSFVNAELEGASTILIRMFLVSLVNEHRGIGIIENLKRLAGSGTKISIYVDAGQYRAQAFVRRALSYLMGKNVEIYIQDKKMSGRRDNAIMHDKLIMATYPDQIVKANDGKGGTERVPQSPKTIIGSAGFSTNVMENRNFENMVSINSQAIFDYFMRHHRTISSDSKKYDTTKIFPTK